MTGEERWRGAIEDEASAPSAWQPDVERFRRALAQRLAGHGCAWPDIAVDVLSARGHSAVDRAEFAERLGLTDDALRALEGAPSIH
jgi:hypothetical protein